jgi:hypothetical protein
VYRLTWRLPLAGLVAFSHLQFSQIRGRQPYLIVRKILYVIFLKRPPLHRPAVAARKVVIRDRYVASCSQRLARVVMPTVPSRLQLSFPLDVSAAEDGSPSSQAEVPRPVAPGCFEQRSDEIRNPPDRHDTLAGE